MSTGRARVFRFLSSAFEGWATCVTYVTGMHPLANDGHEHTPKQVLALIDRSCLRLFDL